MNIDGVIGEVTTLPGCAQIAVSHGVYVPITRRNQGLGREANTKRIAKIRELGYDYIICTVDKENEAQVKIMERNRWTYLDCFYSTKTGHYVSIYGKYL